MKSRARWLPLGLLILATLGGQVQAQTVIRPVALTEYASRKAYELYLMLPDGSNKVRLHSAYTLGEPSFSPTAPQVVIRDGSCACLVILKYEETAKSVTLKEKTIIARGDSNGGEFSPDGKHIVYTHAERAADGSTPSSIRLYTLADGDTPASTRTLIDGQYGWYFAWVAQNRFVYTGTVGDSGPHYIFDVSLNADGTVTSKPILEARFFNGVSKARTRNSLFVGIDRGNNDRTAHELPLDTLQLSPPIVAGAAEKPVPSPTDGSVIFRETGTFVLKRHDFGGGTVTIAKRKPMEHDWRRPPPER